MHLYTVCTYFYWIFMHLMILRVSGEVRIFKWGAQQHFFWLWGAQTTKFDDLPIICCFKGSFQDFWGGLCPSALVLVSLLLGVKDDYNLTMKKYLKFSSVNNLNLLKMCLYFEKLQINFAWLRFENFRFCHSIC